MEGKRNHSCRGIQAPITIKALSHTRESRRKVEER